MKNERGAGFQFFSCNLIKNKKNNIFKCETCGLFSAKFGFYAFATEYSFSKCTLYQFHHFTLMKPTKKIFYLRIVALNAVITLIS